MKKINELSLNITEEEYHNLSQMNYSSLSKYDREGFNAVSTLKEEINSPSLTFGSAVDCLLTDGEEEFNRRFIVYDSIPTESVANIIKEIATYYSSYPSLLEIPDEVLLGFNAFKEWQSRLKDSTKLEKVRTEDNYYKFLLNKGNKSVLSTEVYNSVVQTVRTLKSSTSTHNFFAPNNPFNQDVEKYYQLKFTTTLNGIEYKIMIDELIVDYKNKNIVPIDLKTSSNKEYDFYKSFIKWNYAIQARLYYRVLREVLDKDEYFKDFTISDYIFIVINKDSLNPLVWQFEHTKCIGEIEINGTIFKDPEDLAKELVEYLNKNATVPNGIKIVGINKLEDWI